MVNRKGVVIMKHSKFLIILFVVLIVLSCKSSGLNEPDKEEPIELGAPTLSSPPDQSTVTVGNPMVQWNIVQLAESYELLIDNSPDFSSPELEVTGLTGAEYKINLPNLTILYWKVRAKAINGAYSNWSTVWSFTIDILGPYPPILFSPPDRGKVIVHTPLLDWSDVSDAVKYELEIDVTDNFSNPIIKIDLLNSYSSQAGPLSDGVHYWRVRCFDVWGNIGGWSDTSSFTVDTFIGGPITDIDGNTYRTIRIGDKWWMAENLKVTHYRNGDNIPIIHDREEWLNNFFYSTESWDACCFYEQSGANRDHYGCLYNGYAVIDDRNIAPIGWHVATDDDWKELELFLGISENDVKQAYRGYAENAGGKLKETGFDHWYEPNSGAINELGFSARGGGYRTSFGNYELLKAITHFYSSTIYYSQDGRRQMGLLVRTLNNNDNGIVRSYMPHSHALSIRCVKD